MMEPGKLGLSKAKVVVVLPVATITGGTALLAAAGVFAAPVVRFLTPAVMVSSQRGNRSLAPEYRRLLRISDRMVDAVVVNCEYLRRHLIADEHVPPRLIEVCRNGIGLARLGHEPAPQALAGARGVIGTLCALRPEKGLSTLLEAFANLRPRERDLRLAIVASMEQIATAH